MGLQREPKKVYYSNVCVTKTKKKKEEEEEEEEEEAAVRYEECRKNHAVRIGGYAVDGCREFMASGEEGTGGAFSCAACSCHRSFHKRVVDLQPPAAYSDCSSSNSK